jgi:hypothetical protein
MEKFPKGLQRITIIYRCVCCVVRKLIPAPRDPFMDRWALKERMYISRYSSLNGYVVTLTRYARDYPSLNVYVVTLSYYTREYPILNGYVVTLPCFSSIYSSLNNHVAAWPYRTEDLTWPGLSRQHALPFNKTAPMLTYERSVLCHTPWRLSWLGSMISCLTFADVGYWMPFGMGGDGW